MRFIRSWRFLLAAISVLLLATVACATTTAQPSAPEATNAPADTQAAPADTQAAPESPEKGELILEDQFVDNSNNWPVGKDEYTDAAIEDGKYKIYVPTDGYNWFKTSVSVSDVDVTVDVEFVEGDLKNSDFGLLCRLADNDNFYRFRIGADGVYRIDKLVGGEVSVIVDWTDSNAITTGAGGVNTVRAICSGEHLTLYVNDTLVADVVDSSLEGGSFALMVGAYKEGDTLTPVTVNFSNLIVRKPLP